MVLYYTRRYPAIKTDTILAMTSFMCDIRYFFKLYVVYQSFFMELFFYRILLKLNALKINIKFIQIITKQTQTHHVKIPIPP